MHLQTIERDNAQVLIICQLGLSHALDNDKVLILRAEIDPFATPQQVRGTTSCERSFRVEFPEGPPELRSRKALVHIFVDEDKRLEARFRIEPSGLWIAKAEQFQ